MRTPKIPKNINNTTLSAKKKKKKEVIKNVLASPFNKYWPVISESESTMLKALLAENLPELKVFLSKEKQKEAQKMCESKTGKQLLSVDRQIKHGVTLGINDTTKSLEQQTIKGQMEDLEMTMKQKKRIHAVLVNDVRPKVLAEHLIQLCVLRNIPVLIVPNLSETVVQKCGIRSAAVGLCDVECYNDLHQMIETIAKKYPIPKNHINAQRSAEHKKKVDKDVICDMSSQNPVKESLPDISEIYLKHTNSSQRAFVPPCSDKLSSEFMALGGEGSSKNLICKLYSGSQNENLGHYHSLNIKKYQAFLNRDKDKIENIKNQKKKNKGKNIKKKGRL